MPDEEEPITSAMESCRTFMKTFLVIGLVHVVMGVLLIIFSVTGAALCSKHHCHDWGDLMYVHLMLAYLYITTGCFTIQYSRNQKPLYLVLVFVLSFLTLFASIFPFLINYISWLHKSFRSSWMALYLVASQLILVEFLFSTGAMLFAGKLLLFPYPQKVASREC